MCIRDRPYTFQPSTGATTGIFSREIVETATCDNCHTSLTAHGGARVDVQYCVMCHNPGTTDPYSGNTLDMKVMVHKIHTGNTLPSIQTASGPNTCLLYTSLSVDALLLWFPFGKLMHAFYIFPSRAINGAILARKGAAS